MGRGGWQSPAAAWAGRAVLARNLTAGGLNSQWDLLQRDHELNAVHPLAL